MNKEFQMREKEEFSKRQIKFPDFYTLIIYKKKKKS